MRLAEAFARFDQQMHADGRSPHTRGNYRRHVELLGRWLATYGFDDALDAIRPEVLAAFLVSPEARESAHGGAKCTVSLNAVRTSLRVAFGWFHQAGLTTANAARLIRRAITSPPPPRALSDIEVQRLLDGLTAAQGPVARRDHLLVALLLSTGVRIGSAIALDVEDIDLDNSTLHLRACKGDRVERVYFGSQLRDHLTGYLGGKPQWGPVFRNPRGERLSKRQSQKRIGLWMQRAGVEATVHGLRHTFATRFLRRTGDLFLTQRALRHRSILSTTAYLACDDQQLKAALR